MLRAKPHDLCFCRIQTETTGFQPGLDINYRHVESWSTADWVPSTGTSAYWCSERACLATTWTRSTVYRMYNSSLTYLWHEWNVGDRAVISHVCCVQPWSLKQCQLARQSRASAKLAVDPQPATSWPSYLCKAAGCRWIRTPETWEWNQVMSTWPVTIWWAGTPRSLEGVNYWILE